VIYAVISDVHSNLEALQSVLKDLKKRNIRNIYFLGDAVGYGPEPNECIQLLEEECKFLLAGNHDWGVCGLTDISFFNVYARTAIEWTKKIIQDEKIAVLKSFPVKFDVKPENITLVHSTPYEPDQWHYLLNSSDAEVNFQYFDAQLCFIGHTHRPVLNEKIPSGEMFTKMKTVSLNHENRYIINVGSVGQPRDGDARASYAIVNEEKVEIIRVYYDIKTTQKKMSSAGLPIPLINRLSLGM
jgi:predicted phosphodiesterase